jgi:gluconate 2-dehydrogenase gamma chain
MSEPLDVSRRQLIRNLALGLVASGTLDLEAAQHVHQAAQAEKAAGPYKVKFFQPHEYQTLGRLAELIVPADDHSGSAKEAGAPEFIDLLCSQNAKLGGIFTGGLAWLDAEMRRRHGKPFAQVAAADQTAMLDKLVATERSERERRSETLVYEKAAAYQAFSDYSTRRASDLAPGAFFFDWVRKLTVDAFYTSPMGVKELDFRGNRSYSKYEVPVEAIEYALKRSPFGAA